MQNIVSSSEDHPLAHVAHRYTLEQLPCLMPHCFDFLLLHTHKHIDKVMWIFCSFSQTQFSPLKENLKKAF